MPEDVAVCETNDVSIDVICDSTDTGITASHPRRANKTIFRLILPFNAILANKAGGRNAASREFDT